MQEVASQHTALPAVSVIMAAYNEEQAIGNAIESIIAQTFTSWELIIIDDGSIDGTHDVVRQYANRDIRIRLILNEANLGLPESLNKGIQLARSDLIARADADDINLPERLAIQYKYMQLHSEIDVLGTGAYLLDSQGVRGNAVLPPCTHAELEKLSFQKTHFFHSSVMIRRRFFNRIGVYDKSCQRAEDKELWFRGFRDGCRYANLPEPLIEYSTNGYVKSWRSIIDRTFSLLRMVNSYKIKGGHIAVLTLFVISIAIKLHIYKPNSIR